MTFIHISPFVREKAGEAIYLVQTKERMDLQPASKWDITARMQDVANHERYKFDAAQEVNWLYRWEQLEARVKREKGAVTADKVLLWMYMLENRQSIKLWKGQSEDDRKKHAVMMLSRELVIR
ncbi:hypothetical protein [Metabacillus idriensis]|uniref:hypothetical protein n=1 Tax=Metabacillus idriensis TaxID=324768 RepID=UPI00174BE667|nr:hypothetical protein [Metabacillus idriensis]